VKRRGTAGSEGEPMLDLRRRQFITLLGGTVAAWPLAAHAQQRERMRRIGVLLPATADDPQRQVWFGAFLQGLAQSDWIIDRSSPWRPRSLK
jgi:putative ABC transport system substrate-binding protein